MTGAPKIAAVDLIAELEPVGRGASMGAIGRIYGNGDFDLALTIRTFAIADGAIHLWVGGGIVWDSDPAAEVEESWMKARPLLDGGRLPRSRGGARRDGPRARRHRPRPRRSDASRSFAPTTRGSSEDARRSRRCACTAAGRFGSRRTSTV